MRVDNIWDGTQVVAEHNGSTGAQIQDYVFIGKRLIGEGAGTSYSSSASFTYQMRDVLSERISVDNSGNLIGRQAHMPFGEEFAESGTQEKHHFTTYEGDGETGSDYAISRQYSQSAGKFMASDPYAGSISAIDPQTMNRYSYSREDPINHVDPIGLEFSVGLSPTMQTPGIGLPFCVSIPEFDGNGEYIGTTNWCPVPGSIPPQPVAGTGGATWPPKPVKKHYEKTFSCNKNAKDALADLRDNYTTLAGGKNLSVNFFQSETVTYTGTVAVGNVLNININIQSLGGGFPPSGSGFNTSFSVTVQSISDNSFTFQTNPGHPLDPGTITFAMSDAGDGQIDFSIDVDANADGLINGAIFLATGSAGEDAAWNNLLENVKKKCKN